MATDKQIEAMREAALKYHITTLTDNDARLLAEDYEQAAWTTFDIDDVSSFPENGARVYCQGSGFSGEYYDILTFEDRTDPDERAAGDCYVDFYDLGGRTCRVEKWRPMPI